MPSGIRLRLEGDANDYVGKGLSGGEIIIRPDRTSVFEAERNVIAGNVIGYGATGGAMFLRGLVGERFLVRNSGATAVAEGVGDHALEYMTGGTAVILGGTGRNLGAGMSGGVAYVYGLREERMNPEAIDKGELDLLPLDAADQAILRTLVERHPRGDGLDARRAAPRELGRDGRAVREGAPARLRERPRGTPGPRSTRDSTRTATRPGAGSWRSPLADPKGFLKTRERETAPRRPIPIRLMDWREVYEQGDAATLKRQAGRCMDCGIPFCHHGCPLGNLIPEWNDLTWRGEGRQAIERLHATNNFPEFTGKLCPAPCEERVRARHQPAGRDDQAGRGEHHRAGLGERLGGAALAGAPHRQDRRDRRLRSRGARRGPAAHACRAHRGGLSSATTGSAACCATASPTSRWRSATSTSA